MNGKPNHKSLNDIYGKLVACLESGQERLMDRILDYAILHGYAKYTSTLKEAWRISISGLTKSLAHALKDHSYEVEFGPDHDFKSDPVAAFAIIEAKRHRERGVPLEMFLGLLKYYRQSYHDVINADSAIAGEDKKRCGYVVDRLFDRVEIGFCIEWSSSGDRHLDELQSSNRTMTNEKNKYLTIFESLPFPVILLNDNHHIDNLNHAAALWLGGKSLPGAFYYTDLCNLTERSDLGRCDEHSARELPKWLHSEIKSFASRKDQQYSIFEKEVDADGNQRLFLVQLSKMMDVSGKFNGSIAMIQDFTESRKLEKERARMKEQLLQSDKMASIGQLAAGVAHEINNPIGFIRSNINRLEEYYNDMMHVMALYCQLTDDVKGIAADFPALQSRLDGIQKAVSEADLDFISEDTQTVLQECKEGVDRVGQIVSDLKDFAHPANNKPQFADVNRCLESTVNMLRNEIKYKVDLVKEYGRIPEFLCHPRQLNQVFMNLIVNAAQAIEKKGEIRILTRMVGDVAQVRIADTGCGIAPDAVERIFDPFYTTKPVGSGTGLGLHIAYQIVQQHQGRIRVDSKPGQGTTFTIEIPLNLLWEKDGFSISQENRQSDLAAADT